MPLVFMSKFYLVLRVLFCKQQLTPSSSPDSLFGDSLPEDLPSLRDAAAHLTPLPLTSQAVFYVGPKKFMVEDSPETPCLRVNRLRLRETLATGIEVQWGKDADRIEEDAANVSYCCYARHLRR